MGSDQLSLLDTSIANIFLDSFDITSNKRATCDLSVWNQEKDYFETIIAVPVGMRIHRIFP